MNIVIIMHVQMNSNCGKPIEIHDTVLTPNYMQYEQ